MAKISVTDYEEALKWSYKQYKVTLKRRIEERFVNSYNPEWIRAWNGNMDLQICLDFYGVITYITEYVTKGDVELTSSLILAAKNCKSLPTIEKMKKIARTFSSSRSIGESEMYYKLLTSELHLTDSNVTTKYVPACFPEHRSHFMQVIQDEDIHKYDPSALVEIQGKTRKYVSAPNIIDKYIRRPQKLENMSLMQFSKMYDSISILPAKAGKLQEGVSLLRAEPSEDIEKHYERHRDYDRILIQHENGPNMTVDEYSELLLPKYIELSNCKPGDAKYLRLRSFPLAIKQFMFNKESREHEYHYSELLLYRPFRDERKFRQDDPIECVKLYLEKEQGEEITKIQKVKSIVMEHQESVAEGKAKAQEILNEEIGEQIDPEFEQEINEAENEGDVEHPDYPELVPPIEEDVIEKKRPSSVGCKIILESEDKHYENLRKLDFEQQLVHQEILTLVKGIQKYRNNCLTTKYPKQLKLVVQGGAGCGKSHLINTGIQTTERTIRKQADNPDHPCIIPTAPTGTAANLINGRTLHGAFNFSFSTEYISYSSELKDLRREQLKNLVLIVVDEIANFVLSFVV